MKIVILSSRFPFPIEKGDKLRLYHQMKGLAKNHEIHLISLSDEKVTDRDLEEINTICKAVYIINISKLRSYLNVAFSFWMKQALQISYFYRKKVHNRINEIIKTIDPDVIYCQLLRMARYAENQPYSKILDYMDAFSLSAHRRSIYEKFPLNRIFNLESGRIKNYEHRVASSFDHMTVISVQDKEHLVVESEVLGQKLSVINNGLDTEFFKSDNSDNKFELVFVGNMGYHPNILASLFLVKKVLPLVKSKAKILIAGSRPSQLIKNLNSETVKVSGWMEDIREAYNSASIFVAPIFSGAGQQNKILEAMSMGLCCITTGIVARGIGATDQKHLFVENDEDGFARRITQLLQNPDIGKNIGIESRKFVKENFSWELENKKLDLIISKQRKIN